MEFTKAEQRYLNRYTTFKRPQLWKGVLVGIAIFAVVQVSEVYLSAIARVIILVALYALLLLLLLWERVIASGIILKLQGRIKELEFMSRHGSD